MTKKNVSKGAHAFKTLKEVLQILNRNELILNKFDDEIVVSTVEMD
jgi:DNA processing protein